ncbi:Transcriptional regulator, MerR family [Cupriavidus sp. U2]|uniref:MerR family transcriptional regulator n=1 Tax=Cupriavidus sp. U2 TaxID=2920269 RepID=UPI00129DAE39|nr:MerR family transcriptional regulator [Cupriavidus sp. U2]KAI3590802.1 Transcriptional regulator, MerR family [Cupriavidus sp. U2]
MKIGELAKRTGLAPSRIRFYEGIGLLKVERQANGYRSYPSQAVLLLNLIASAQQAGFTLDEIRALLPPDLAEWQHGSLVETLRNKVRDIEAMEARLAQSKAHIHALLADIEGKPAGIDCATNAKPVLSHIRSGEMEGSSLAPDDVAMFRKASRRRREEPT